MSRRLRKISAEEFAKRMRVVVEREREKQFAFFLGAGCSISSGIPAASRLVRNPDGESDWLRRLRDVRASSVSDSDLDKWASKQLLHWDPGNPGASYGELIGKLFLNPGDRQEEIHRLCTGDHITRQLGYVVLSGLLTQFGTQFNVALTTNFDDLLSDALAHFRLTRPLVITHDSLAPFIRSTPNYPLIVKLHGDHQLAPQNTADETRALDQRLAERIATVLHDRGLIVMGYGGNDESIIAMLRSLPKEALPYGIYWVSGSEPVGLFRPWLEERNAVWVAQRDFDLVMMLLERELSIEPPDEGIFNKIFTDVEASRRDLGERIAAEQTASAGQTGTPDWWIFELAASGVQEESPDVANRIYQLGIAALPNSSELLGNYAIFLDDKLGQKGEAKEYYERATKSEPKTAIALNNYALYLDFEDQELDSAEDLYKQAIETDPSHADSLGNYAVFLYHKRGKDDEAETLFERAIDVDPSHVNNLVNYAQYLLASGKTGGMDRLREVTSLISPQSIDNIAEEAAFYWYAHGPQNERAKWLGRLKKILKSGIRSEGWDLMPNVQQAIDDGHPGKTWLPKLAAVISGKGDIASLSNWKAWKQADELGWSESG